MKKTVFLLLAIPFCCLMGCKKEEPIDQSVESWNKFYNCYSLTCSLSVFDINIEKNSDNTKTNEKKVLRLDDDKQYSAMHQVNGVSSYWKNGITYYIENNEKLKKGESLESFLNTKQSEITFSLSFETVNDWQLSGSKASFSFIYEDSVCNVQSNIGKHYLNDLYVEFYKGSTKTKDYKYEYVNPGSNPSCELPTDLDNYHY